MTPERGERQVRSYRASDFSLEKLIESKQGRAVSVVLPARDEERTIGPIVRTVVNELTSARGGAELVDEVIVVDDGSLDATAEVAAAGGALVVKTRGEGGKGQAMRVGLAACSGDLVLFLDSDVENFSASFVTGMLGPLLCLQDVTLVKGSYNRPLHGVRSEGGRVTELVAKPVIELLFPALGWVSQPLAGESAAPRAVLENVGLAGGYEVEMALLIDVAEHFGTSGIVQVDLGTRIHRNRPLAELRPQATDVLRAALERSQIAAIIETHGAE